MAIVYKIRRKSDGLFSMGGSTPNFNKTGKIWKKKGHLTSHLSQLWNGRGGFGKQHVYIDCEIVPYELSEIQAGPGFTIFEYLEERKRKLDEVEQACKDRHEKWEKEQRRKEYESLKQEFEE
jgi:hypothetical protein